MLKIGVGVKVFDVYMFNGFFGLFYLCFIKGWINFFF